MNWYYANAGQQAGPVSEEEFQNLVQAGTIKADTLVWHEGLPNWQPYSAVLNPASAETSASPNLSSAVGGGPLLPPVQGITKEQLLARDYQVPVGEYLGLSWQMFTTRAGIMIGVTALVGILFIAINAIPYLSIITSLVLNGAVMGGFWLFLLKAVRGGEPELGDAFGGFGPRFGQLLLANLVPGLLAGLCIGVVAIGAGLTLPALAMARRRGGGQAFTPIFVAVLSILFLVGFSGFIYLTISWMFTIPLVAERKANFWSAMELSRKIVAKHWWRTFGLAIVCGLLNFVGMLFCLVGMLVTVPVTFGAFAHHYQRVFGDLENEVA